MHHEAEYAHHCSAAIVELDGALLQLGRLVELVPAEVDVPVAEVADEFILACDVLHDGELEEANEEENLAGPRSRDGVWSTDGGEAVGEGVEGVTGAIDVAREVESGAGGDLAKKGELGDAPVLELDVTEAVKSLLVGAIEEAEGIVETEGGLGAKLGFEGIQRRGGLGHGGGGEGGGGGDGGGEDDRLHGWRISS